MFIEGKNLLVDLSFYDSYADVEISHDKSLFSNLSHLKECGSLAKRWQRYWMVYHKFGR